MVVFQGKGEGHGGLQRQGRRPWWPSKVRGKVKVAFQNFFKKGGNHDGISMVRMS